MSFVENSQEIQDGTRRQIEEKGTVRWRSASVKVAALLDRQAGRRVMLQPDYFGFLIDESFVFGYGMGAPKLGRNLSYVATTREAMARAKGK